MQVGNQTLRDCQCNVLFLETAYAACPGVFAPMPGVDDNGLASNTRRSSLTVDGMRMFMKPCTRLCHWYDRGGGEHACHRTNQHWQVSLFAKHSPTPFVRHARSAQFVQTNRKP